MGSKAFDEEKVAAGQDEGAFADPAAGTVRDEEGAVAKGGFHAAAVGLDGVEAGGGGGIL